MKNSLIEKALIVPGLPHILLANEKSKEWKKLYDAYAELRKEIEASNADIILYFSTQWLSVIGYLFQADPKPSWTHVDHNWHEFGSIPYEFKVDTDFPKFYADEVRAMGHNAALVNYNGFPIDTGTIVAQKLLNPKNKISAAMVSCNMYAEKLETLSIGKAAGRALQKSGKRAIAVLVSSLSNRFFVQDIDPREDHISSQKDDEWNKKICELLGEGRLEDVAQVAREFGKEANGDMGFKGIWWLSALCGETNKFKGKVYGYGSVWGTGAALISLTPTEAIKAREEDFSNYLDEPEAIDAVKKTKTTQKNTVDSAKAAEPVGPYPHARREGEFLFLSGIGPRARGKKEIPGVTLNSKGEITAYDIEVQTRAVVDNLKLILEEAGATLEQIVDVQVFLTNMNKDFPIFNKIYGEYFAKIRPTRTTVEVGALPTPIAVEFKVIAKI